MTDYGLNKVTPKKSQRRGRNPWLWTQNSTHHETKLCLGNKMSYQCISLTFPSFKYFAVRNIYFLNKRIKTGQNIKTRHQFLEVYLDYFHNFDVSKPFFTKLLGFFDLVILFLPHLTIITLKSVEWEGRKKSKFW